MVCILEILYKSPNDKRADIIDKHFDFDKIKAQKSIYYDSKDVCNEIINLICKQEYDIEKMRIKFNKYISNLKEGKLSSIFIVPYKVTRKEKGEPSYETEKYYESGCRKYRGYITHYEFHPYVVSKEIDNIKIDRISKEINLFFDFKEGKKISSSYWENENDFYDYLRYNVLGDHCAIISDCEKFIEDMYNFDFPY